MIRKDPLAICARRLTLLSNVAVATVVCGGSSSSHVVRSVSSSGEGMAVFVSKLEPFLRKMLGADARLPRILCSDRGPGFYQTSTGHIVEAYRQATVKHGFRTFAGNDASGQPADMPDFWPHETAVSWLRALMKKKPLQKGRGLDHMQTDLAQKLGECVKHINAKYEVGDLCSSFPRRVDELIASKGERLGH